MEVKARPGAQISKVCLIINSMILLWLSLVIDILMQ